MQHRWHEGVVVKVDGTKIKVHFKTFEDQFDETFDVVTDSLKLCPAGAQGTNQRERILLAHTCVFMCLCLSHLVPNNCRFVVV
jgi:hypothetical protein